MSINGKNIILEILSELRKYLGFDFLPYKESTISRRIKYRMSIKNIQSVDEYYLLIKNSTKEREALYNDILVKVTRFFRNKKAYESLYRNVIPNIIRNNKNGMIKIWSVGCSTGEEAYSLAILLKEYMDNNKLDYDIKILATDVDSNAIEFSRCGKYPKSIAFDMNENLLSKYFTSSDKCYVIKEYINNMVVFANHNILEDYPFSEVDLLVCRNLFIYLKPEFQKEVVKKFSYSIKNNGYLFLGSSESTGELNDIFVEIEDNIKIYKCEKKNNTCYFSDSTYMNKLEFYKKDVLINTNLDTKKTKESNEKHQENKINDESNVYLIDKINNFKKELKKNKEELQATIEELESSNEELQSINEELIVSNKEQILANAKLEKSKREFADIFNNAPVAYMIFNFQGQILSVNNAFCKLIGENKELIIEKKISRFLSTKSKKAYKEFIKRINEDIKYLKPIELIFKNKITNQRVYTEINFNHSIKEEGWEIRATIFDVTIAKTALHNLEINEERYRIVFELCEETLWEYNIASETMTHSTKYNNNFLGDKVITNYRQTMLSKENIHEEDINKFKCFCDDLACGKQHIRLEMRSKDKYGQYTWFLMQGTTVFNDDGIPIKVIGKTSNIDDSKKEQERLKKLAKLDPLTKILNKSVTRSEIEKYFKDQGLKGQHGFIIIDIDNFKSINDNLGHLFGDAVLTDISTKIEKIFSKDDIIGRIGGDEFVVLLKNYKSIDNVKEKANEMCKAFKSIYTGENKDYTISTSIGISLYPRDGDNYEDLLNKADIALYNVKDNGKDNFRIYELNENVNIGDNCLQKHNETKTYSVDRSLIDSSFVANIIELLFDSKDTTSSINIVLSMIGKYYNVSKVSIVEELSNKKITATTYEWRENKGTTKSGELKSVLTEKVKRYRELFNSEGIFYCNDISIVSNYSKEAYKYAVDEGVESSIKCAILDEGKYRGFIGMEDCSNKRYWTSIEISTFILIAKTLGAYLIKLRSRQEAQEYTYIDKLTGAWNLNKFILEVDYFLKKPRIEKYALIYADIEKFKYFNDTYGYLEGDRILIDFKNILDKLLEPGEVYARGVADKFIILIRFTNELQLIERFKKFNFFFNRIYKNKTDFYRLSVTAGVCLINPEDKNIKPIIDRANTARKTKKGSHKSTYVFYNNEIEERVSKEKEIEDIMEDSLINNEFIVYYQPKIKLRDKSIIGAEALVRWKREGIGLIPPLSFIPLFEKNGFVVEVDFYVFEQVCKKIREWLDKGKNVVKISVNFSRAHLNKSNFIQRLQNITEKYSIPKNLLEIEITESAFIDNSEVLIKIVKELKDLGFSISMDDFGAGYSALNLLKELPVDVLKLDKDFFKKGEATDREKIIISNVINMAKQLNITVISEGVETIEQSNFLNEIGCDMAQGYLFAKPMVIEEFENIIFIK